MYSSTMTCLLKFALKLFFSFSILGKEMYLGDFIRYAFDTG